MTRRWWTVFDHDFNTGHGRVVVSKAGFCTEEWPHEACDKEHLEVGQEVMLVTLDGMEDGFGTLVSITGFDTAHDPDYFVVRTDLPGVKPPPAAPSAETGTG